MAATSRNGAARTRSVGTHRYAASSTKRKALTQYCDGLPSCGGIHKTSLSRDLAQLSGGEIKTETTLDPMGRTSLVRTSNDDATGTLGIKVESRYKILSTAAENGCPAGFTYEATSNPYTTAAATDAQVEGENKGWTRRKLDRLGRVVEVESFDGPTAPCPWGTNTTSAGKVITAYDADSTTVTDGAGQTRQQWVDGLGRLVKVREGNQFDTIYVYDESNNLVRVEQDDGPALQRRDFVYDSLSRLTSVTNPESGTTSYTYFLNGTVKTKTDARGTTITYSYDSLNRVTQKSYTDGTPAATYTYDTNCGVGSQPETLADNGKGRLCAVSNSNAATRLSYDDLGRVRSSSQTMFGNEYGPFTYSYDLADNLVSETYPSGRVVSYGYHGSGRVKQVQTNKSGQTPDMLASGLLYSASGAMRRANLFAGRYEEWCRNSRLQTTRIRVGGSPSAQNNCGYQAGDAMWLELGYRTGAANNGDVVSQAIQPVNVTQTFGYDALGRISTFADPQFSESYGYDRWGNRWLTARTGGVPSGVPNGSSWYDAATNQMKVTPGQTQPACPNALYDCAGNQVDVRGVKLTYDGEGRVLEAVAGGSYIYKHFYDGEGRRVGTAHEQAGARKWTTAFVYDAMGKLVAEYTVGKPAVAEAARRFVGVDHLGSTRMTMDGAGGDVRRFDYLPFGESLGTASRSPALGYAGGGPRMMFTGQARDFLEDGSPSGLDYFLARYMSAAQGRFTSPDEPLLDQVEDDPQSWNLYGYVRNNPLRFTDPSGQVCVSPGGGNPDYDDPSLPEPTCEEIKKQDETLRPSVSVSLDWDEQRLMMLRGVSESLSSPQAWGSIVRGAMENAYPIQSTIVECAASAIGGNCPSSDSEVLYAATVKPKLAQAAARVARLWAITKPAATKVIGGRTYMKDAKTGTWWSRDTAGHGGSAWKVYREKPGGALEWMADADAHGNFISGKHKSPIGTLLR